MTAGIALAGGILGLVAMALATWGLVITVSAVDDAPKTVRLEQAVAAPAASQETASQETVKPRPSKSPPARRPIPLGTVAKQQPFTMRITSVSRHPTVSSSIDSHRAQGSYVVVRILVENVGDSPTKFDGTDSRILDAAGKQYNPDSKATISQNLEVGGLYHEINPGQKVTRVLVFDLPRTATPVAIRVLGVEGSKDTLMSLAQDN